MLFDLFTTLLIAGVLVSAGGIIGFAVIKWDRSPERKMKRRWANQEKEERERKKNEEKSRRDAEKKAASDKKALDRLRDLKTRVKGDPAPPPVPVKGASSADITSLEEYKELHGDKIPFELTRLVRPVKRADGTEVYQRLTVMRGMVKITVGRSGEVTKILFIKAKKELYYVNPRRIIRVEVTKGKQTVLLHKLEFDILYAEAMDAQGNITWDDDLEMILADSGLDQYVTIASADQGFQLTPALKKALLIVGFLGLLMGLAINGSAHIIPQTVIHWVP